MREIKFRAWDKLTNKMIDTGFHVIGEVTAFGLIDQYVRENMCGKSSLERYNDIEITQFTGLKDKNGVEIYEGDIVKQYGDFGIEYNSKVYYFEGRFAPLVKVEHGYNTIDSYNPENFEIVGNIFENADLIK